MIEINMESCVCKDGSRQLSHGSNPFPRCFFKIMIGNFREVLFIPPKFAEILVSLVDEDVYLEDFNGKSSKVKISRVDGSLAFEEGWHDFVVDHCIDIGEVLIFKYVGGSLFLVQVFGRNACERVSFVEGNNCHLCEENITKAGLSLEKSVLPRRHKSFEAPNDRYQKDVKDSEPEGDLSIPTNKMRENECVASSVNNDYGSPETADVMDITRSLISRISRQATQKPEEKVISPVEQPKAAIVNKNSLPNLDKVKTEHQSDHVASLCVEENLAGHENTYGNSPTTSAVSHDPKLNFSLHLNTTENGTATGTKLTAPEEVTEEGVCAIVNNDLENEFSACRITHVAVDSSVRAPCMSDTGNVTRPQDTSCHNACVPDVTYPIPKVDFVEGETSNSKHAGKENGSISGSLSRKDISPLPGNEGSVQDDLPAINTTKGNSCQFGILHDSCQEEDETDGIHQQSQNLKIVKEEVTGLDDSFSQDSLCLSVTLSSNPINWLELPRRLPHRKVKRKKDSKVVVLQDPSYILWPVLYYESVNFIGFLSGWKDFAIANNLQRGNQCDFFDVAGNDVFQVKITQSQYLLNEL